MRKNTILVKFTKKTISRSIEINNSNKIKQRERLERVKRGERFVFEKLSEICEYLAKNGITFYRLTSRFFEANTFEVYNKNHNKINFALKRNVISIALNNSLLKERFLK